MVTAIRIQRTGGPDVLDVADVEIGEPGHGKVLVEVSAAGVNYIDTYQRSGLYPVPLPYTPGLEGAGRIIAVGAGVTGLSVGDRVAWQGSPGSYAEQAVVPAEMAVRIPEGVTDESAAAVMLQGITAHYLTASTHRVREGETVLVHAAAGGVGLLLTQLAKAKGARVIGTVSTPEKEQLAREAGADEVIRYTERDFVAATREFTGGEGVDVVYDGVGASTYEGSLSCLRPRGLLALFGASSGPVPPIDPQRLNKGGSLYLTRPTSADYTRSRQEIEWRVGELFDGIANGTLNVRIGARYALADARKAHEDLEGRRTTGKVLLLP
ncbi:quinone oxidoreductase family protein [Saccharomonospora xinjiangensis]|uniref:Zn-dependent oxidoreductase, NADPH:quinone reductase n=1 Tax=Saccharomonospora xinjiangensis XJ-54 TaxID=882086 RepID=I0UXB3_9PSEU|nr:quinone oxidoreductase [Saccharomonospora xinjiangensis]EID52516.1 Zn-dependent oxidoreductase, NADPH:quinone reductase [Saccharomonospora xinjiangensis XJ-54]